MLNCVQELISRAVVFRFVFCAQDEFEALVGCVGKLTTFSITLEKIRMKNIIFSWRNLILKKYFPNFLKFW